MITKSSLIEEIFELVNPCKCDACNNGCNYGSGSLVDGDLKKLAEHLEISEEETKEKYLEEIEKFNTKRYRPKLERKKGMPYGKCTFYDKKSGCGVHDAKPMECKIAMGCKNYGNELITWFNLNYYVNLDDPESVRQWATAINSGGKNIDGGSIPELIPNKEKRKSIFKYDDIKNRNKKDWNKILGIDDE
ncbi:hypothetical protein HOD20_00620 [archaeon]|jgi:Fe-S-cluster containining protein|nr:hypothetical protein [archaeon]MBT4647915.1 hypothetical protein [archaeon]MBT7393149.1 hypothetical protein [archaeon]